MGNGLVGLMVLRYADYTIHLLLQYRPTLQVCTVVFCCGITLLCFQVRQLFLGLAGIIKIEGGYLAEENQMVLKLMFTTSLKPSPLQQ